MGITFKKHPRETGLRAVGYPHQDVDIKLDKKPFGIIYSPNWKRKGWTISFAVKDDKQQNNDWKWTSIRTVFKSEQQARQFIKDHEEWFAEQDLHFFEDDE